MKDNQRGGLKMRSRLGTGIAVWLLIAAPGALQAQNAAAQQAATLRPGDQLLISVWPSAELGGEFTVEESGFAYLPFLERVRVAGVSMAELRQRLTDGYALAVQNPVVSVTPLFRIGIMGEVRNPGQYFARPTDQLFDMIGQAGGFSGSADTEKVRIVRQGQVVELDAARALKTGDLLPLQAMTLRSGDIITVGHRGGLETRDLFLLFNTLLTTAVLIDRLVE